MDYCAMGEQGSGPKAFQIIDRLIKIGTPSIDHWRARELCTWIKTEEGILAATEGEAYIATTFNYSRSATECSYSAF